MAVKKGFVACKDLYTSLNKQQRKNEGKLKFSGSLTKTHGEKMQLRSKKNAGGKSPRLKEKQNKTKSHN